VQVNGKQACRRCYEEYIRQEQKKQAEKAAILTCSSCNNLVDAQLSYCHTCGSPKQKIIPSEDRIKKDLLRNTLILVKASEQPLTKSDCELLLGPIGDNPRLPRADDLIEIDDIDLAIKENVSMNKPLTVIFYRMWKGFFNLAENGYYFTDKDHFNTTFNRSLENSFKGAPKGYERLAISFFTLKLASQDINKYFGDTLLNHMFSRLEIAISSIFFWTPGPIEISFEDRLFAQKAILQSTHSNISPDDLAPKSYSSRTKKWYNINKKTSLRDSGEKQLGNRWLDLYTYGLMPLGIILQLAGISVRDVTTFLSSLALALPFIIFQIVVLIGLSKRRLWGWKINFYFIIIISIDHALASVMINDTDTISEFTALFFIGLIIVFLLIALPNIIYFNKRKYLFS